LAQRGERISPHRAAQGVDERGARSGGQHLNCQPTPVKWTKRPAVRPAATALYAASASLRHEHELAFVFTG